jgi:DNA-binding FadR family transcriptional regulator
MKPALEISPVFVPKAADVLAGNLREQILDGRLHEGAILPNERELASQAGLSRASVREALRILEVEGLIATRTGRNGGSEVVRPSMSTVERSVGIFIRGQRIRFEAVLEAREAIEPQAARLASLHHTPEDWAELVRCHQRIQAQIDDIPAFLQANLDWHLGVVRAGRNELLIAFVNAIAQSMYAATDLQGFNSAEVRHAVVRAHQKVMDAIEAGDADAAARRMGRHVGAYVSSVEKRHRTAAEAA